MAEVTWGSMAAEAIGELEQKADIGATVAAGWAHTKAELESKIQGGSADDRKQTYQSVYRKEMQNFYQNR